MRRRIGWMVSVAACVALAGGCSSGGGVAVSMTVPAQGPGSVFEASGPGVDDRLVCAEGSWTDDRVESMDGAALTGEDFGAKWERAVDTNGVMEAMAFREFTCTDGSGTLLIEDHVKLDFSELDADTPFDAQFQFGPFELSGTGSFASTTGSGTTYRDGQQLTYEGEVE